MAGGEAPVDFRSIYYIVFHSVWAVGAMFGGGYAAISGLIALKRGPATRFWSPVSATILRSRVRCDGDTYEAEVSYKYEFAGEEHECSQIRLIQTSSSIKSQAERVVKRYKPAVTVLAYVNPQAPGEAVLEPGPQPLAALFMIAVGTIFLGLGVYLTLQLVGILPDVNLEPEVVSQVLAR